MAELTESGASGTGTQTLTYNFDPNTSGSDKTYVFNLKESGSSTVVGTLTVTQLAQEVVAVTSVTVDPDSITINKGSSFSDSLSVDVQPDYATDTSVTWSSDSPAQVAVNAYGQIRGVAVTSTPVKVYATSNSNSSKKDYCSVSVVNPGSIILSNVSADADDTSASMSAVLSNIDTSTLNIQSSGQWVTVGSYDSSNNVIPLSFNNNEGTAQNPTSSRDAIITMSGRDLAGATRTDSATLSQAGSGGETRPLISLSVSGSSTIADDGNTEHTYTFAYDPTDTTETGVTWDVVDATSGNSVVGTKVSARVSGNNYLVSALSGANNDNVRVMVTSNVRPLISGYCAVNVTYVAPSGSLTIEPSSVNLAWNATSDSTPVVTWGNVNTPTISSYTGLVSNATFNAISGVIAIECTANPSTTQEREGTVVISATRTGGAAITASVTYRQYRQPDPYSNTSVAVDNLTVFGGVSPGMSADVTLHNGNGNEYEFPTSFSWVLYGSESSSYSNETQIATGTKTGYTYRVSANSNQVVSISNSSALSLGNNQYFRIVVSIDTYSDVEDTAELSNAPTPDIQ